MFIEELADAVKSGGYLCGLNAARALKDRGVIFVLCVNPDGCEISINGINACGELGSTVKRLCLGDFEHGTQICAGLILTTILTPTGKP